MEVIFFYVIFNILKIPNREIPNREIPNPKTQLPHPSIFMYSCILLFYYSITPVFLNLNLNLNLTLNLLPPLPFYTPL
jgi:hypothetical protein